jgi:hypothetical protein
MTRSVQDVSIYAVSILSSIRPASDEEPEEELLSEHFVKLDKRRMVKSQ